MVRSRTRLLEDTEYSALERDHFKEGFMLGFRKLCAQEEVTSRDLSIHSLAYEQGYFAGVAPRRRGWFSTGTTGDAGTGGCPAQAWMVPGGNTSGTPSARLPRAGVDGSEVGITEDTKGRVAPRRRGWFQPS